MEARKHAHKFCLLVEIMYLDNKMSCFLGGPATLTNLKQRFCLDKTESECVEFAHGLINESLDNWRSNQVGPLCWLVLAWSLRLM